MSMFFLTLFDSYIRIVLNAKLLSIIAKRWFFCVFFTSTGAFLLQCLFFFPHVKGALCRFGGEIQILEL